MEMKTVLFYVKYSKYSSTSEEIGLSSGWASVLHNHVAQWYCSTAVSLPKRLPKCSMFCQPLGPTAVGSLNQYFAIAASTACIDLIRKYKNRKYHNAWHSRKIKNSKEDWFFWYRLFRHLFEFKRFFLPKRWTKIN